MFLRIVPICALMILMTGVICMAADGKAGSPMVKLIDGQAELGTVEIHGVGAGDFQPELWEKNKLNFLPDVRSPLIEPRKRGVFRNIYAPSAVDLGDGWRVFYGAWDGVDSGNDRIYSVNTKDFLDFENRQTVIEHGDFIHVCNVNAIRLPSGEFRLVCTAYPDKDGLNKPAVFSSPDGVTWNGSPAPYPARMTDLIAMDGYAKYKDADINGMNVILYEDGVSRLYFDNFKDFGKVYRATSADGKHFEFEGPALEFGAAVNDVKRFDIGGAKYYLMGLHMNGDTLWFSLSRDGRKFDPVKELAKNLGPEDRYIVAIGWVVRGKRLVGYLYGAGAVPGLNRNRIFARWLQKKVVFVGEDGTRYEAKRSLGPDRQIIEVPQGKEIKGRFEVYAEDGSTPVTKECPGTLIPGGVYVMTAASS